MVGGDQKTAVGLGRNILASVKADEPARLADRKSDQAYRVNDQLWRIFDLTFLVHRRPLAAWAPNLFILKLLR